MNRTASALGTSFEEAFENPTKRSSSFAEALKWMGQLWGRLRIWVAICVTSLAAFCIGFTRPGLLPSLSAHREALAVVFLSTLLVYNVDGVADAPKTASGRSRAGLHLTVAAIAVTGLVALLIHLPLKCCLFVVFGALLSGAYALPLPGCARSLKELPYLKGPFVGAAVGTAVVWVPLLCDASPYSLLQAVFASAVLTLYCTANALLFDVPDQNEDRVRHVPTLALTRGVDVTRRTCMLLCLMGISLVGLALTFRGSLLAAHFASIGAEPRRVWGFVGLSALGLFLAGAALRVREETKPSTMAMWVDGALLLPLIFQRIFAAV